jgi:iron(III) transport system ATP-binding protein
VITLHNVTKSFGQVRAISDVSFSIARHASLALVGPSGSGKSTILRLIAGLEEPDAGSVEMDGQIVSRPGAVAPPHTRGIGMVFQRPALWPHLTVAHNIAFGLAHWQRRAAQQRLEEVLRLVELQGMESRHPHQLSGGEAQRVALARALAPRPRILLLDEPLSNLDPELYASMLDLIRQVQTQTGVTLIFVSHDPLAAAEVCEHAVVLQGGRVVQTGTWDEVEIASVPRLVSTYGVAVFEMASRG